MTAKEAYAEYDRLVDRRIENKAIRAEVEAAWDAYQTAKNEAEHPTECTCRPNSTTLCVVCQASQAQNAVEF